MFLNNLIDDYCYSEIDGVGCLYTDYIIKSSDAVVRLLRTFFLSSNSEEKGRILDQVELYLKNELKKIFAAFDDKEIVVKLFDTMVILGRLCITNNKIIVINVFFLL